MGWRTWNDRLSLLLLVTIPALWLLDALYGDRVDLGGEVRGALIATWTLVIQFYFRQAPPQPPAPPPVVPTPP